MTAAFAYLIGRTVRNRLASQARRIRSPRYALAFLFGLAYFGFVIFGRQFREGVQINPLYGASGEALAPLFVLMLVISGWLLSADGAALAFSQAEVSMLFTAPVTRRALIVYKLARAQIAILISALLMVLVFGRGSHDIPHFMSVLSFWVMFSTINLHSLGAALVRARVAEATAASERQRRIARVLGVFISIPIALAFLGPMMTDRRFGGDDATGGFFAGIVEVLSSPAAEVILTPFRFVAAPTFATTASQWITAFLPAVAIALLHLWWVMKADTRFEEAAAAASERRARQIEAMRSRRGATVLESKAAVRTISLGSRGHPIMAIIWKNTLALMRVVQLSQLIMPVIMSFIISAAARRSVPDMPQSIAVAALFLALTLALLGGLTVRNDLRSDMLHLPLLKSVPLSGRQMVLAQVLSGALPLAALQMLLVVVAAIAVSMSSYPVALPGLMRTGAFIAAPFMLLAFNMCVFTMLNATAILFPGWVRLGPGGGGGIELMGQAMLMVLGVFLSVGILAIPPVFGIGLILDFISTPTVMNIALALIMGAVVLALETYGIIALLGRSFERAEPTHIATG
jgi:ABC-2 type transport system permease protein